MRELNEQGIPQNTDIQVREDFRFYPVVFCEHHPGGVLYLSRKGKTVSFRTEQGAKRYLLRTFGDRVACSQHKVW